MVTDLLKTLAKSGPKMAILLTIHQPSYKFLSCFDKLITLSNQNGNYILEERKKKMLETCEYFGHPVLMHDSSVDFIMDFMMEIASDHGMEIVKKMTRQRDLKFEEEFEEFLPFLLKWIYYLYISIYLYIIKGKIQSSRLG